MSTTPPATVNLYDLFNTDEESEEAGKWLDIGGPRFKVRSLTSKKVNDLRDELYQPYLSLQRTGAEVPEAVTEAIGDKVLAGAIIAGWENVTDKEGNLVNYSAEEATKIMKALPKLASFIIRYSSDWQNFRSVKPEDSAKN